MPVVEPPIRLREALAQSRNMVAARVVIDVGPQALAEHATRVGITSTMNPTPSLALGTADVTPLEMTNAYATWDAAGQYVAPILITRITGPDGRDLPLPTREAPRQAVTPDEAYVITSMMTSVVDHGTGQRAKALHRPIAGKTGTSNDAIDAWFVGYTPDLVAGVWVGFDDRKPLGPGEEGARAAVPIWTQFMRSYIAQAHPPPVDFVRPPGVAAARIDPITGFLARPDQTDAMDEIFLAGTEPTQIAVAAGDAGAQNFFQSFITGGDGGIPIEAPAPPPGPPPTEPALTLPNAEPSTDASAPLAPPPTQPPPPIATPPVATPPPAM
jgi:penicillin-binding protein 1A